MCGIYSLLNVLGYNNTEIIQQLKGRFSKGSGRGPDNSKFIDNTDDFNAIFGFHRLSINGLNNESDQPLIINNKLLICNGEIYNYKQLYSMYNITPKTHSDCEVIIHLYEMVGFENMIQMLDGVFAFNLLDFSDPDDLKFYVSRDPLGVRPLFIAKHNTNSSFGFTSVMKQFDTNEFTFSQFTPGTWSLYKQNPIINGSLWMHEKTHSYFDPYSIQSSVNNYTFLQNDNTDNDGKKYEAMYKQIIYDHLCNAVKKRVENTDRPVACLLSGGLDSSLITALVCRYYQNENRKLETYSIGMEGSEDLVYARKVADFLHTDHHEIIVSEEDFLSAIPCVINEIESYDTTTVRASVGNYLVAKYISENSQAKVLFNGDGSDEVTGGYMYFHAAPNAYEFDLECKRLLKDICYFDVLRSDRSISCNGLEARTPFLDKAFVCAYLSIPAQLRCHNIDGKCEKHLLRSAFDNKGLLPDEVLWRTKEAFSDGVSKQTRSWYQIIQEHVSNNFTLDIHDSIDEVNKNYTHNTPKTSEQMYYRGHFENKFNSKNSCIIPYFWMPRWVNATDASARTLDVYKAKVNTQE
jgi:asparagine synthase (glutamine-hydrolysing)